eukprot:COSAG01_NODE_6714_length_3533_cov_4.272145_3_plen_268_part_00
MDLGAQHPAAQPADVLDSLSAFASRRYPDGSPALASADCYGAGGPMPGLEADVAARLGKPAACFLVSGTAANQAAVRAGLSLGGGGGASVALHKTSHMVHLDCLRDGETQFTDAHLAAQVQAHMLGLRVEFFGDPAHRLTTAAGVRHAISSGAGPAGQGAVGVVVLEIPQRMNAGMSIPFEELTEISALCRQSRTHLHMDGARIWEASPYYLSEGHTMEQVCALFDSIYVSFYKGLNATTGATHAHRPTASCAPRYLPDQPRGPESV